MTWVVPTTIKVRLSIAIGVDLPTAAILCNRRPCWLPTWLNSYRLRSRNNKDASAGAIMIESYRLRWHQRQSERRRCRRGRSGGRRIGRRLQSNVPCIWGQQLMIRSMWSPGRRGLQTTTSNALKIMKEQYYCYVIEAWNSNMIFILLMYERAIWLLSYKYTKEKYDF